MTPEELQIIAQLVSGGKTLSDFQDKPAAPAAPPPDPAAPYNAQATKYNTQADSVEKDMATPYPEPHGVKENIVAGIRSGMQDFGRLGVPGGSTGQEALRRKQFDDQNAQRLDRVKSLRSGAQAQQDLGQRVVRQEETAATNRGNLAVNQQNADRLKEVADQPVIDNNSPGTSSFARNKKTGMPIEGTTVTNPAKATAPTGIAAEYEYAIKNGYKGSFIEYQNEDANRKKVNPPAEAGNYLDLRDDQGRVVGAWNPKSNEFKPVPQQAEGLRRTPVPQQTNQKLAELDNSLRKITDLGTAYSPDFVGPTQGRYEKSKASGILSYLPFLATPEGYPQFSALSADLKNSVIKLITGAQMGQQEAQRILQQVPTETDKPELWAAKYDQTKKNAEYLMNEAKRLSGAGGAPVPGGGATPPPAGGNVIHYDNQGNRLK